jgi:hypothetical protein
MVNYNPLPACNEGADTGQSRGEAGWVKPQPRPTFY